MKLTDANFLALAEFYLQAELGQKINGLIHNLNNHIHIVDMQLSMLVSKASGSGDAPLGDFREKISRAAAGTARMIESLQANGRCAFYTQKSQAQINVHDFLNWLVQFWSNDLYFKHRIDCELISEAEDINLRIPPFYLTVCLDQGIRNALEAYQEIEKPDEHKLMINAVPDGKGVSLSITSFTRVPDLDPWVEGSSSKQGRLGLGLSVAAAVAGRMGWHIDLQSSSQNTVYLVSIPGINSSFSS